MATFLAQEGERPSVQKALLSCMLKMRQLQTRNKTLTFKLGCEPAPHFYHIFVF